MFIGASEYFENSIRVGSARPWDIERTSVGVTEHLQPAEPQRRITLPERGIFPYLYQYRDDGSGRPLRHHVIFRGHYFLTFTLLEQKQHHPCGQVLGSHGGGYLESISFESTFRENRRTGCLQIEQED